MGTDGPLLEARAVNRVFVVGKTRLHVLRDIGLAVNAGEALAIVGASGAGKSTLLHILGGLDCPTSGAVLFKGCNLYGLRAAERTRIRARQIGFVFQSFHLLPELDVIENVALPTMAARAAGARGGPGGRARAAELLEAVGLAARAEHLPGELSGGEQQRVALARALVNEPEIVFADEPTGNLDSRTGALVLDHLFNLTRRKGRALVLVTHNAELAARCDRIATLADGQMVGQDRPDGPQKNSG